MSDDGLDFTARDIRRPTLQQWTTLRRSIVARAKDERQRTIRDIAARAARAPRSLFALASLAIGAIRNTWRRIWQRQQRLRDLHELSQLDDLALKDMGISRLDIGAMRLHANHAALGRGRSTLHRQ